MAPSQTRQLLVWTLPTIAVIISYLWFRKKRTSVRSDPGGKSKEKPACKSLKEELEEAEAAEKSSPSSVSFHRIDSAPIDIIIPPELKSVKSNPVIISDEDLDLEIEKIKSMKSSLERGSKKKNFSSSQIGSVERIPLKTPSPKKERSLVKIEKEAFRKIDETGTMQMEPKNIVTVASVEEKLSAMKICTSVKKPARNAGSAPVMSAETVEREDIYRQNCERDSANHSPADVMLASPSLSCISDNHSEGSSDSGKGGSDVVTPPSRTPACDSTTSEDVPIPCVYEFVIPQNLVGRLIGRHGTFVAQIKDKTHAHILIKKHPGSNKMKVCAVEGTQMEVENALEMIREKFPEKQYPEVTLEQVSFLAPISTVPLIPDHIYLKLVEGVNNDAIVSCMVAPNHLFLQQPTHPTFPNLNVLSACMNMCYADDNSPLLPNPIPDNTVCVAHSVGAWYRSIVLTTDVETETSYIKFLDYGGYASIENSNLRQIRRDFVMLPFQAAECVLANIRPVGGGDGVWLEEAYTLVADLTRGAIVYTQIVEYLEDGTPLVFIYVVVGHQVIFLNEELVTQGFAEWASTEEAEEGAVGGITT